MSMSIERGELALRFTPLPDMKMEYRGGNISQSLQLYFKITNKIRHKAITEWIDGRQSTAGHINGRTTVECIWIDASLFNQPEEVFKNLAPKLYCLGIWRSEDWQSVIRKITEKVKRMERSVPRRRKVMVIDVDIFLEVIHRHRVLESDVDRVMRESTSEYENRNYGMIAADPNSLKMMKIVKLGRAEECTICLDKIDDSGFGMAMPCDHVFHAECILKWLQINHSCPLCRFAMPTDLHY